MQINELVLKNFGKFHDRQINLEEGINLIHGENESGKSTIHTFIKGMLFGIERGRGRAAQNDTFSIYEPWDNPNYYSGTLKFASGGKHFRIERNFDKYSKKAELVCIEDGEVLSVEDGDLRMLLGEMNVDRYENTVSMSQRNAQMGESMAMELKNYATNYYTSGNGEIDLNGALEQLKGRKKVLENEIRMEMSRKQQKREKLEQEVSFIWRDVHHLEEELDRVEEELEYRAGKEEEKRKERQLEGEHGKGVMDEIRPEKWRIHPMEILIFALVIVAAVIILSRPWNYLVAIVLFLAFGLYVWNRMKVGKKQVKTEPEIILEEITQEEEKVPIEKLRWEKAHITEELKEKTIQYDNLGEQLAELDEINEQSREYEMKRQAVQMAAEHLEQLSGAMRGYFTEEPWYVVDKDVENNILVVAQGHEHPRLMSVGLIAQQLHWVDREPFTGTMRCTVKTRYRQTDIPCTVKALDDDRIEVIFDEPVAAVTPGQSAVFYNGEVCLGGGIIEQRLPLPV